MAKKRIQNLLKHVVCILLCLCVVLPFYMVLINSFKTKAEAARMSLALPTEWVFSNYSEVIEKGSLIQGFLNSFAYALIATTLGVVLCSMAAFVMCRKRTKLNVFLYYFVLCGLFFPVNYVTLVRVLSTLHLNDTRVGIIMVFTSAMIPFCVFTIRNFVISVPVELDEAAASETNYGNMFYPSVHDSMERFPHTFVSVKQEPSLPDDNGCISVLRKEQELLELYFC